MLTMDKFKNIVTKVLAFWAGIGTLLITFGSTGTIDVPEFLLQLFSVEFTSLLQETFDAIIKALGLVILVAQTVRGYFAVKEVDSNSIQAKILNKKQVAKLYFNPFKSF